MSDEPVHIELEHLKRVRLEPDDVIVVQVAGDLSGQQAAWLKQGLSEAFPGHKIGILTSGAQLGVVRPVPGGEPVPDNSPEAVMERYRAAGGLRRD